MGYKSIRLLVLLLIAGHALAAGQGLPRSRYLGANLRYTEELKSTVVTSVREGSPAQLAGLKVGDRIVSIDGQPIHDVATLTSVVSGFRDRDRLTFQIAEATGAKTLAVALQPLPVESIPGVDVTLDEVRTASGARLRVILTRPAGSDPKPRPGLFLAPWLSCSSVETPFGPNDGTSRLFHSIARNSGFVTFRVDRAGVGDSRGADCRSLDFNTELQGYRDALRKFKSYPFVDSRRIFILGLSNGGGYAPMLGVAEEVSGYVISGGWSKTWYEHMLEIERRRLALSGQTPAEINSSMKGFELFYTEYLIHKKTPAEIIRIHPELKSLWYDEPEHQYGRPAAFYQQLQDLNLAEAWQKVKSPVLILYGEYDWIMSRSDHEWISEIVNHNQPGLATFVEIPRMDHGMTLQKDMKGSFQNFGGGEFDESVAQQITDWLKSRARRM